MTDGALPAPASGGIAGRAAAALRLGARLLALLLALLTLLTPTLLARALRRPHNPWPRRFLALAARVLGIRVRLVGTRAPGTVLILANHVSWIDILAIGGTGSAFVGHDGLAVVPLVRWLARLNDTVFIARHDRAGVAAQVAQLRDALAEMGTVSLFPEGTTGDGVALLPFKSSLLGALEPLPEGVVIQPVWLDYGTAVPGVAWVGAEPGVANFRRIAARARPVDVRVHFLPPLAGEALAHRKAITAAARSAIAAAMAAG
ncbi:MAG: 1-acyl-sn-glycerol-3-phosphate acyltransferase [Sphingomonadales bacterium]|nr:1-acyl-sn-glycerol-3-phosphate acyltransferase [Sphingomonadales bacterium]